MMYQNCIIYNISKLIGIEEPNLPIKKGNMMNELQVLENAYLIIRHGKIFEYGSGNPKNDDATLEKIDAQGGIVMPGFIDSHTHIVFAATREEEFVMRLKGKSYEEIANAGGGILNSAQKLKDKSEQELFESALIRLNEMIEMGTIACEIKSGYGLSLESELKMLNVIKRLKQVSKIPIKATFLGAHAFPKAYKENQDAYINIIINEMLPEISRLGLADYIDVFCDQGFFTPLQTETILKAAQQYNLIPKIHANELGLTGGVQVGVKMNALTVDHLEHCEQNEIEALQHSETIPVGLPGTSLFLGIPYFNARKLVDHHLPVVLASDFNPGSCPSGNMALVMSLGCIKCKLLPNESFNAVTKNAAFALNLEQELGTITIGKKGSVIISKPAPNIDYLAYCFGNNWIYKIILN